MVWGIKGDLDYFTKALGLKHYGRDDFCECCPSEITNGIAIGYHSYNFRLSAQWKNHVHTAAVWRARNAANMHKLFARIAYLSCVNLEPDELHVIYLGVAMYVLGPTPIR